MQCFIIQWLGKEEYTYETTLKTEIEKHYDRTFSEVISSLAKIIICIDVHEYVALFGA